MKGFVKIVEAIIASLIILVSLTFFFSIDIKQSSWDNTLLQIRSQDLAASLALNGTLARAVDTNNQRIINDTMLDQTLSLLPATMDYSLEIRGIPNPVIYIGCNCSIDQIRELEGNLTPLDFTYKERNISIRIAQDSLENIRPETNTLFLFGYNDLNSYKTYMDNFLERGGTIFMKGDLNQTQVEDGFINKYFGLSWNAGSSRPDPITGNFLNATNENMTTFKISKYYNNLTNESFTFNFNGSAKIEVDERSIVYNSINAISLIKVNKEVVDGNGRTVWMSDHVSVAPSNLTKAVIMWASGERFLMNKAKTIPSRHLDTIYIIRDKDTYEAILTLWRVFQ